MTALNTLLALDQVIQSFGDTETERFYRDDHRFVMTPLKDGRSTHKYRAR